MRNKAITALIEMGMPASIKGFDYIVEAMCLLEKDITWKSKITALYWKISQIHNTTSGGVERDIRHAFFLLFKSGSPKAIKRYLTIHNKTNGNLLTVLYYRLSQGENRCELS